MQSNWLFYVSYYFFFAVFFAGTAFPLEVLELVAFCDAFLFLAAGLLSPIVVSPFL